MRDVHTPAGNSILLPSFYTLLLSLPIFFLLRPSAQFLLHHPSITSLPRPPLWTLYSCLFTPCWSSAWQQTGVFCLWRCFQRQLHRAMRADAGVVEHSEHTKGSSSPDSYRDWLENTQSNVTDALQKVSFPSFRRWTRLPFAVCQVEYLIEPQ